jgi:hypothetical protein
MPRLSRLKRPSRPKALWFRMLNPAGVPAKIRSRIRPRSERQEERMEGYRRDRAAFLALHPWCQVPGCQRPSRDVHHTRGKAGALLLMQDFWRAVCRAHHNWIGDHPAEARSIGMLCQAGEWNQVPTTKRDERKNAELYAVSG